MKIIEHGTFSQYFPEPQDGDAQAQGGIPAGYRILYCKNEAGIDWYDLQKKIEPGAALVEVDPQTGRYFGGTGEGGVHDYSTRWPLGKRLLEVRPASAAEGLTTDMRYRNGAFEPMPPPVPASITRRQFYTGLALRGFITEDEAFAVIGDGTKIPAKFQEFVAAIADPTERFKAKTLLAGADIERNHPMTDGIAARIGWDRPKTDDFFLFCATL